MPPNSRTRIIGITGSIGSGKTAVSKIIEADFPVFYADEIAHQVLRKKQVMEKLLSRWGTSIIDKQKVSRKAVADIVFKNQPELDFLNSVVHPEVLKSMQGIVDESTEKVIFFEIPLLFEADLSNCFDLVILVVAKKQTKIERIQQRDHVSVKDIQDRINSQTSDEIKVKLADLVINNDGTMAQLQEKVQQVLSGILNYPLRDVRPFFQIK